ncbi:hypothetical protein COOONC_23766 [Cooperia oncophora]
MDSSNHSLARRLSFESTTTSEFEIVPRERSSSGSTVGGSYCKELSESSSPSPAAASFNVPDLFIANSSSDHSPPQCDDTAPKPASPNGEASIRPFTNTASQASGSDMSTMARESAGMLEQVFHELFTIKQRNSMLERMAQQSHEWRTATEQLEKETKILHKTVKACKNRVGAAHQNSVDFMVTPHNCAWHPCSRGCNVPELLLTAAERTSPLQRSGSTVVHSERASREARSGACCRGDLFISQDYFPNLPIFAVPL